MNEQDDPGFDDAAFDDVRALLAEARVTGPVPDDVAARLDATLASLQARRAAEAAADAELEAPSVVVPLRRRLRAGAGRVLVAASVLAVVGAGGVGIAQLSGTSGSSDKATSADRAENGAGGSTASGVAPQATGATGDVPRAADGARTVPELTTAAFAADAARVMVDLAGDQVAEAAGKAATPTPSDATTGLGGDLDSRTPVEGYLARKVPPVTGSPQALTDLLDSLTTCAGPSAPDAVVLPATLDGGLVALVFRPPADRGQRVEAWSCDGATLLQAATVPTEPPS